MKQAEGRQAQQNRLSLSTLIVCVTRWAVGPAVRRVGEEEPEMAEGRLKLRTVNTMRRDTVTVCGRHCCPVSELSKGRESGPWPRCPVG